MCFKRQHLKGKSRSRKSDSKQAAKKDQKKKLRGIAATEEDLKGYVKSLRAVFAI